MQVARSFFSSRREWGRKVREILMALLLEHRFTKQQIFELYANEVYLGNRASFAIRGFGEAATAYFGKDVRQLGIAEVCLPGRHHSSSEPIFFRENADRSGPSRPATACCPRWSRTGS